MLSVGRRLALGLQILLDVGVGKDYVISLEPATISAVAATAVVSPRQGRRGSHCFSPHRRSSVVSFQSAMSSLPISQPTSPDASSASASRILYPEIEPYHVGSLPVSDVHTLYYEMSGNPAGKPVVVVHGGPGGGTDPKMRRYFDPAAYQIILFDQRGCGKSTPHACLEDNTTWHLVEDMEKLREKLAIDKWMVFGGSWGSTLSLAYATTHPERVTELVLRGIFLLRRSELLWFYQEGASWVYPDAWEHYLAPIPEEERGDLMAAYYKRLTSENPEVRQEAARAWSVWEGSTSYLRPSPTALTRFSGDEFSLAFARIECHYFVNRGFFETDGHLLKQVDRIRHIPTVIVQGRYDMVCPMKSAWDLHRAWPESELVVVTESGHSANEPGIMAELVRATDKFRSGV